jgi:hypothetical protein
MPAPDSVAVLWPVVIYGPGADLDGAKFSDGVGRYYDPATGQFLCVAQEIH